MRPSRSASRSGAERAGERRVGRDEQHPRVGHQLRGLERALVVDGQDGEGRVDVAGLHAPQQRLAAHRLDERDVDVAVADLEAAQQRREDADAHRLERADPQRARRALAQRLEVGLRRAQPVEDPLCVAEHERAGLGRAHRRAARAPLQQRHPDDPLERRHLLAQRGLGVAELGRGARERALADDRVQRGEVAQLDAQQPISTLHRSHHEL